jgi:cell division protein FtsI (penicillin-binding protein 3)
MRGEPPLVRRHLGQRSTPRLGVHGSVGARSSAMLSRRLRIVRIVIVFGVGVLVLQLVNLQVLRSTHFQDLSADQLAERVALPALRGTIYDRSGQILAMSIPTKEVVADDFQITSPVVEAAALAPLLGVSPSALIPKLEEHNGYVVLASNVSVKNAAIISNDFFSGITLLDSSVRTSPDGVLGASVVGTVDAMGAGSAGLEYQYQQLLAGQSGEEQIFESPYGVSLPTAHVLVLKRPVAGTSIELTLDAPLQFKTEQFLANELVASGGLSGTAIVMDSRTGQILSMANLVNLNQHDSTLPSPAVWRTSIGVPGVYEAQGNLGVTQVYEPGSVFKIVPFSASLLGGVITPTTPFEVPDYVMIDGHLFHDAEQHGLERLTATQVLEFSSNIGTYEITRELGEAGLLAGVRRLGFGEPTGLNFPGESAGLLTTAASYEPTDIASLPIGQEDAVTAQQVLDAYNVIANGGVFVTPSLVRAEINADGSVEKAATPKTRRALSSTVAEELTKMLVKVVSGGTGTLAAVPGYTVAGKTGTSQIPYPGASAYIPGAYNATFVGFAPAQNPVLTMIVVIQRPTPVIYGGDIAAPVFSEVMNYALHRYGIPASTRIVTNGSSGGTGYVTQDVT